MILINIASEHLKGLERNSKGEYTAEFSGLDAEGDFPFKGMYYSITWFKLRPKHNAPAQSEKLLDLGLKNRQDLTPTFENINVEEWVKQYHELNYDLEITETELKVARSTHKELFGGEEEEAEDSF